MQPTVYNIRGNKIFLPNKHYKKFRIILSNGYYVHVYDYDLIELVDDITKRKHIFLIDEYGLQTVIFRKHIVKIKEEM
ncbi:hypothetical protein [Staphylococcus succinus]|uniref:hypothetical protein n=1 Tax=Staphylococcus succinus TaxID=61015 RepID=UPI00301CABE5